MTAPDPHDPRQLPLPQQIALLTLRGGELALACISRLRSEGASSPSELDYIALTQARLALRHSNNRRMLTPIGKHRADSLARAIAQASAIHVVSHGRSNHGWVLRCSCGEFSASRPDAMREALGKVMAAGGRHLRAVSEKPPAPVADLIDQVPEGSTKQALREIFGEPPNA